MTEHSQNSQNGSEKKTMEKTSKVTQIEGELRNKGWNVEKYVSFMITSGEQVVGELSVFDQAFVKFDELLDGRAVKIIGPKRFVRLQQMSPQGISVLMLIGEWDVVDPKEGHLWIKPITGFRWADQDLATYEELISMVEEFVKRSSMAKAMAAGLVMPGNVRPKV